MPGYLVTNASPHSWYIPAGTESIRPTPNDTIGANGSNVRHHLYPAFRQYLILH